MGKWDCPECGSGLTLPAGPWGTKCFNCGELFDD